MRAHPVSGNASAQITTAQGVSGGSSLAAAGVGYLSTPAAPEFALGSNSFTVEAWVFPMNLTNAASTQGIVTQQLFDAPSEGALCLCVQNGQLIGNITDANGNVSGVTGATLPLNTWTHVALVGTASTLTLYANGQSVGSAARGAAQNVSAWPVAIGADGTGAGIFSGYIDEVRYTNGVARYNGNFSPSAPYPNSEYGTGGSAGSQTLTLAAGQQGAASIAAVAGNIISVAVANVATTPSGGSITLTIANPDGSTLASFTVNDGASATSFNTPVLTQNGTYVLSVNPGANGVTLNVGMSTLGPLSVTLTNPGSGATLTPDNVSLSATVTEQGGAINQVAYYNGTNLLGTATQAPYGIDLKDLTPGTYTLTAQATDAVGRTATSSPVTITVVANGSGQGSNPDIVYDIHADQLNTPRMITDQGGNIVWQWDNDDPFGNNLPNQDPNGTGNQFLFNLRLPGQYYDIETGTLYNYFRDYDPVTGRYLESDPIGLFGEQFSTYGYVGGNPNSFYDPFGLDLTPGQQAAVQQAAQDWSNSGVPYVFGGANKGGADCSGSISAIYAQAGINIGRKTSGQFAQSPFTPVTGPPQLGDVGKYPGHVVIFGGAATGANGSDVWSASHTGGPVFGPAKSSWYGTPRWYRYNPQGGGNSDKSEDCKCKKKSKNASTSNDSGAPFDNPALWGF